jgi:hypothetical protein
VGALPCSLLRPPSLLLFLVQSAWWSTARSPSPKPSDRPPPSHHGPCSSSASPPRRLTFGRREDTSRLQIRTLVLQLWPVTILYTEIFLVRGSLATISGRRCPSPTTAPTSTPPDSRATLGIIPGGRAPELSGKIAAEAHWGAPLLLDVSAISPSPWASRRGLAQGTESSAFISFNTMPLRLAKEIRRGLPWGSEFLTGIVCSTVHRQASWTGILGAQSPVRRPHLRSHLSLLRLESIRA